MAETRFEKEEITGKTEKKVEALEGNHLVATGCQVISCVHVSAQLDTLGVAGSSPVAPIVNY